MKRLLLVAMLVAGSASAADAPAKLPSLKIDPARVTVAGLSSGAYMATQAQVAYPDVFHGAALVAGGPYGCAGGKLETALGSCMKGAPAPDVNALATQARTRATKGEIGPLSKLATARIYALHGAQDALVAPVVGHASAGFYEALKKGDPALAGMTVVDDGDRAFAHNLPISAAGDDCGKSVSPFLGHCGFDAAGEIFAKLYGKPAHAAGTAKGELRAFDQDAYRSDGKDAFLAAGGFVYLPPDCLAGKPCGVMVALHGCKQNADLVGKAFVEDAGFNRWADVYDVAVLYPQTRAVFAPLNPQACWDWWGYSGENYDTRAGVQLRWLVDALHGLGLPAVK
ncbi:extracellular catalytic domain type 2 short-chain-length polyhydroxyalkanoate depolymerase [Luteibacter sp. UNCMF366Tsu5.1]|uniref:extracellular catalytic domain type 2 short-chain-length polyhydroxyalkanoate depolymerase n=1 Tax=Luteibacter sp. UNCMF366Tsu5.1 TaxID=1502758 RepID=UPI00090862C4|nr:PHB depolymerase family esterase [Luteibacter sp. UNCMF366Tsu5.1]SFW18433.1 Esterase PHB depolymerase [Luteibacter sp. UNCMF366Tsu5.1]